MLPKQRFLKNALSTRGYDGCFRKIRSQRRRGRPARRRSPEAKK
jgi:hypothetical protein